MRGKRKAMAWKRVAIAFLIVSSLSIPLANAIPGGINGPMVENG